MHVFPPSPEFFPSWASSWMPSRPWCCRGGYAAASASDQLVLSPHLDSMARNRKPNSSRRAPGKLSGILRAAVADFSSDVLGSRTDLGFAFLQYGVGEHFHFGGEPITFGLLVYHSGETFFTLGYGDVIPNSGLARALAVIEAGLGFGFLGVVIGYLPTIYSSFSRREIEISLLDARAGSPPSATELLARFGNCPQQDMLDQIFNDWERWAAEVLESHLSYPALSFFRSQHNNQSWLGA